MADWEEKLNAILADPQAMGQIAAIAKAFSGGGEAAGEETPSSPPQQAPEPGTSGEQDFEPEGEQPSPASTQENVPDLSALLGLLGGGAGQGESPLAALGDLDPGLIQKALSLYSAYAAGDDRKAALLAALNPFLKEKRQARVDRAIRIAKLSRVVRAAFALLGSGGEEGAEHV